MAGFLIIRSSGGGGGGGSLAHDDPFTITGSGFGSNTSTFTFLGGGTGAGGAAGTIEATGVGSDISSATNWDVSFGGVRGHKQGFNDATRGRVLTSDYSAGLPDCGAMSYDTGSNIGFGETMYHSWYEYYTNVDNFGTGQIKQVRNTFINDLTDPNTAIYTSSANHASGLMVIPAPNVGGTAIAASNPLGQGTWFRNEVIFVYPSAQNVSDGKCIYRIWNGSAHPSNIGLTHSGGFTETNINIYPDGNRARWVVFQNYMGNSITTGTVRQDDHYVQRGSRARIELCDSPTYSSTTKSEIQPWTSWGSTSIAIRINKGGIGSGVRYLHVIDNTDTSIFNQSVTII